MPFFTCWISFTGPFENQLKLEYQYLIQLSLRLLNDSNWLKLPMQMFLKGICNYKIYLQKKININNDSAKVRMPKNVQ